MDQYRYIIRYQNMLCIGILLQINTSPVYSQNMQEEVVSGVISDNIGPLPGVFVVVKGADTKGAVTDMEGASSIQVNPETTTLIISCMGMKTQELVLDGRVTLDITLEVETYGLEEVIAVGYGYQKKKSGTGDASLATLGINALRHRAAHQSDIPLTLENVLRERRVELVFDLRVMKYIFIRAYVPWSVPNTFLEKYYYRSIPGVGANSLVQNPQY